MSNKSIDVAAIGTLAVDYFALLPTIPSADEKIMAEGYEIHPGGVAGNVITQLGRLGVQTGWFGKLGDDDAGKILLEDFHNEGIDYSHAEVVKGEYSMFTWIQVDQNGERAISMFPNVLVKLNAEEIEQKHKAYIQSSKVLHTEACLIPLNPIIRAMEIAKENGVKIVFDLDVPPSYFVEEAKLATKEEMSRALELADVLIPCKKAAKELIGSEDLEEKAEKLLDFGSSMVAVTLGDRGCLVLNSKTKLKIPPYRVPVVDTTGAGDAFHGGFIFSLLKGYNMEESGKFANACGGICCTKVGARSMGTLQDVEDLMRKGSITD